jgi:nitroreductase
LRRHLGTESACTGPFAALPACMDSIDAIYARRSTRQFSVRDVDQPTLERLLLAAVQAPSDMSQPPWLFAIVQDRQLLAGYSLRAKQRLIERAGQDHHFHAYESKLRDASYDIFHGAGTLVVIAAQQRGPFSEADCRLAAATLMLAAAGEGLGTCSVGLAVELLNDPAIKAELSLSPETVAVAAIIVGYPRGETRPVPRRAPRIVSWRRPAPAADRAR